MDKVQAANQAKLKEIPGYRNGTYDERCDNCAFLKQAQSSNQEFNRMQGFCNMFRAYVSRFAVCDKWKKREPRRYRVQKGRRY